MGSYVGRRRVGDLVYLSGHGSDQPGGRQFRGKVGTDLTLEEGYAAAQAVGLNMLANLKAEIGELSRVKQWVKVLGMVNCGPDFGDQPKVINGFSDLMLDLFGEKGRHARSAVGMSGLPSGIPVEIEAIVEVE
jgi:enamine deaminase RidA (YjgF/YER057c/UK114 family)